MRQIHEGKYEVLCYHKKKEFKCFTFINKFFFGGEGVNRNLKYNAFENIFIYFKNAVHVISKYIRVPVCKAIVSIFQVSLYWWIFKIGSKLFVLKISIAWMKLIQWLTVDELYICNDISLHIRKKRCLNFDRP